jgi:hypothetical protein
MGKLLAVRLWKTIFNNAAVQRVARIFPAPGPAKDFLVISFLAHSFDE